MRVDVPGHQTRPASLVTGADARAIVAMEILVEQYQITPVRIALKSRLTALAAAAELALALIEPNLPQL